MLSALISVIPSIFKMLTQWSCASLISELSNPLLDLNWQYKFKRPTGYSFTSVGSGKNTTPIDSLYSEKIQIDINAFVAMNWRIQEKACLK